MNLVRQPTEPCFGVKLADSKNGGAKSHQPPLRKEGQFSPFAKGDFYSGLVTHDP